MNINVLGGLPFTFFAKVYPPWRVKASLGFLSSATRRVASLVPYRLTEIFFFAASLRELFVRQL
jgi:hypothetical protein